PPPSALQRPGNPQELAPATPVSMPRPQPAPSPLPATTIAAAAKPEPVTASLFAAPPAPRAAQPVARNPAIPTPHPLAGAIHPILSSDALPKSQATASSKPAPVSGAGPTDTKPQG
ncbi:MAG: hypothetical protein ACREPJ_03720, partial [Rhodanobacteraceae bacterium]